MRKVSGAPGLVRCWCVAAVLALSVTAAHADPVTVSGSISLNALEGPSFDLSGPTFEASVFANPFNNGFDLVPDFFDWCGRQGNRCLTGDSLKMGGTTNGDAFIGTGTVVANGTTYTGADIFLDGTFAASNVTIPAEQLFVDLTTPFTFAGTLRDFRADPDRMSKAADLLNELRIDRGAPPPTSSRAAWRPCLPR